jgi:hypothetical protein
MFSLEEDSNIISGIEKYNYGTGLKRQFYKTFKVLSILE